MGGRVYGAVWEGKSATWLAQEFIVQTDEEDSDWRNNAITDIWSEYWREFPDVAAEARNPFDSDVEIQGPWHRARVAALEWKDAVETQVPGGLADDYLEVFIEAAEGERVQHDLYDILTTGETQLRPDATLLLDVMGFIPGIGDASDLVLGATTVEMELKKPDPNWGVVGLATLGMFAPILPARGAARLPLDAGDVQPSSFLYREVEIGKPNFNELYGDGVDAYFRSQQYALERQDPQTFIQSFASGLQGNVELSGPLIYSEELERVGTSGKAVITQGDEQIVIGTGWFRDSELFATIYHEEMHLRLAERARQGDLRAIEILNDLDTEEEYVEAIAQRYLRMYQSEYGPFEH